MQGTWEVGVRGQQHTLLSDSIPIGALHPWPMIDPDQGNHRMVAHGILFPLVVAPIQEVDEAVWAVVPVVHHPPFVADLMIIPPQEEDAGEVVGVEE